MISRESIVSPLVATMRWLCARTVRFTREQPWLSSFLYVCGFCAFSMAFLDRPLAFWFRDHLDEEVRGFFKIMTEFGLAGWWFALAGIGWLACMAIAGVTLSVESFEGYAQRARSFLFMIVALGASSAIVTVLKIIIGRNRPRQLFNDGLYGLDPFNFNFANNSFPSGHSQTICAAMLALYFIFPRYDLFYLVMAVLVTMSRAVTSVHYLSDVVMGAYIAVVVTVAVRDYFEADGQSVRFAGIREEIDHG